MDGSELAGDLMLGAKPIGDFLGVDERQVYHLNERRVLPIFKFGNRLAARKSRLRQGVEKLEDEAIS